MLAFYQVVHVAVNRYNWICTGGFKWVSVSGINSIITSLLHLALLRCVISWVEEADSFSHNYTDGSLSFALSTNLKCPSPPPPLPFYVLSQPNLPGCGCPSCGLKWFRKTRADMQKKDPSIAEACSTQWAVSLRPVNQLRNMMDGTTGTQNLCPDFAIWFIFRLQTRRFLDSLQTNKDSQLLQLSLPQLLVTVIHLFFVFHRSLTLHNLWGSVSHRPITLSSGDPVMRGKPAVQIWSVRGS